MKGKNWQKKDKNENNLFFKQLFIFALLATLLIRRREYCINDVNHTVSYADVSLYNRRTTDLDHAIWNIVI